MKINNNGIIPSTIWKHSLFRGGQFVVGQTLFVNLNCVLSILNV